MIHTKKSDNKDKTPHQIVEASLRGLKTLATVPHTIFRITRVVEDPGSTAEDLDRLISSDPSLTARVLKVVNASYYGVPRSVDSLKEAIVLLGFDAVKNIAIASCFDKFFKLDCSVPGFAPQRLWTHSVVVATAANDLSRVCGLADANQAFMAGLIHDIGIVVALQVCPASFAEAISIMASGECQSLRDAEMQAMGVTHEDYGLGLCRKWNFPLSLESAIGFHHQPMNAPYEYQVLTKIVHLADLLAKKHGLGLFESEEQDHVDSDVIESLGISESDLEMVEAGLERAVNAPL